MTEAILNHQNELPIQNNFHEKKGTSHIELVKRFLDFKKQGKNVYDLYLEKRDEYLELSRYQCMVNDCIFWTRRKEFVLCMENYVHDFIDFEHFELAIMVGVDEGI